MEPILAYLSLLRTQEAAGNVRPTRTVAREGDKTEQRDSSSSLGELRLAESHGMEPLWSTAAEAATAIGLIAHQRWHCLVLPAVPLLDSVRPERALP